MRGLASAFLPADLDMMPPPHTHTHKGSCAKSLAYQLMGFEEMIGFWEFWPNQWIKPSMNSEYDCITGRENLTEGNKPQGHALERSVCSYPLSVGLCLFVSGDPWGKQLFSTTPPLLPCSTSPQAYSNSAKQLWTRVVSQTKCFLP